MSQDTDLTRGGHTYSMSCDTIEVTSMSPPMKVDPTWEEVDDHGHAHRADGDTYGYVVTESWVDADGDDRDNGAYRCTTCEAVLAHVLAPWVAAAHSSSVISTPSR